MAPTLVPMRPMHRLLPLLPCPPANRRVLFLPCLLAGMLLGGCEPQSQNPPAGTGTQASSTTGAQASAANDAETASAHPAAADTDAASTRGPADARTAPSRRSAGGLKPDEGTEVLPSDPPAPEVAAQASGSALPSGTSAQAIDDATALRRLAANHCLSCHQHERKVVGPAFRDIGRRHAGQPGAEKQLTESILRGGSGRWGPVPMPPQPHVNDRDLKTIVDWILQQHTGSGEGGRP